MRFYWLLYYNTGAQLVGRKKINKNKSDLFSYRPREQGDDDATTNDDNDDIHARAIIAFAEI